jgi:hypothetical protein
MVAYDTYWWDELLFKATKSQAMVVDPRLLQSDDACQILLDDNTIGFHHESKKLTWYD